MRKTTIAMLLTIAVLAFLSLLTGATYLDTMLPGGLPLGNVVTALGLCAVAGAAVGLSPARTAVKFVSRVALFLAVAWLPLSITLAGNLALNFSGWRGSVWLGVSLAVVLAALCSLLWAFVAALLGLGRRADSV